MTVVEEVQKAIYELGQEGRLVQMQLQELIGDLEEEELLIIKDYSVRGKRKSPEKILEEIIKLDHEELKMQQSISKILGYDTFDNYGYRLLNKVPRMPNNIVENLVKSFKSFQHILMADIPQLDEVDGIGEVRARTIKQALKRMQEQFVFDNVMI